MTTRKTTLVAASNQWAVRPADQRFWNLEELLRQTRKYADESVVAKVPLRNCEVVAASNDIALVGPSGKAAQFQHYSFGQFSNICGAPAAYLRTLPAELSASCLNHGMMRVGGDQSLMFHQNGGLHLRCVTSDEYKRIWNWEIAEMALALQEGEGWMTPPARPCGIEGVPVRIATSEDVLRNSAHPTLGIKVGDKISPAGLYASDHDCFIFQVNEHNQIDGGDGELMYRGVFWSNSEVGSARFRATLFLYDTVCGNHIVWGAKTIAEISIRHTGEARRMFAEAMAAVTNRVREAAMDDELRIHTAKRYALGKDEPSIIDLIFRKQLGLSKQECQNAMALAVRHEDDHGNNPYSAWGYAAGVTRLSQQGFADDRDRMDRAAGKILEMAF